MSDIKIIWDNDNGIGDIEFVNGELTREEGLETAVFMSLFTDRRADISDVIPDGTENRRGWWGDLIPEVDNDQIGSRLWLLDRSATNANVLVDAEFYIREALEWMIEDDVCEDIEVNVERQDEALVFEVKLKQSDGNVTAVAFNDLWIEQVGG